MIVSNESISGFLPDVSITEHYDKINEAIASTYHMIKIFDNSKSIVDTFSSPQPASRICTMFAFTPGSILEEKKFFPLEDLVESRYYYGVPADDLKTEKALYRKLLDQMKKKLEIFPKVSYGIYETSYENKIGYGILYSNQIQEEVK